MKRSTYRIILRGITEERPLEEVKENLEGKKKILRWLVKNKIKDINKVGRIISDYYKDPETVLKMVEKA